MHVSSGSIWLADALEFLRAGQSNSVDLIYVDPPFNTGKIQKGVRKHFAQDDDGNEMYGGKRYALQLQEFVAEYNDDIGGYLDFISDCLSEARRMMRETATIYVHLDYREVHYVKIVMDSIFGRDRFLNEIIWAYDYGGKTKKRWPPKHDNILVYTKSKDYTFNADAVDRIPYMAPGLAGKEKAARGKRVTDVHWHTIVPTNGIERTGYPNQKPVGLVKRFVAASSNEGDLVVDFFAGAGTTGEVAEALGRDYILCDNNPKAIEIMRKRLPRAEYHRLEE